MKTMILAASLLAMVFITTPLLAVDEHHPEKQGPPVEVQKDLDKADASLQQMQEMRKKIETEKTPTARKELLQQHMGMMKDGMNMMTMMGGQGGMMMEQKGTDSMPMADRMGMMEKKMAMMEKMMSQGGMMGCQGMMGAMMGGDASGNPMVDRMGMMEKKMMMMQEMMNGMMMQQEMMMK
jgi:hypothetical protein